ncbi:MAG: peptide-binding protein, partial [Desulfovibrionaceae bacterium]
PGGRLVMATLADATNLVPQLSTDSASHEVADQLYIAPIKYDKDLNIVPFAAESYQVLDGGRRLCFTLRRNLRWSDGAPLTAEDMAFTYRFMVDPKTPTAYSGDWLMIKDFKVTGPYGFEADYAEPFSGALETWLSPILPRHVMEGRSPTDNPQLRTPISSGPYLLKQWVPGSHIVLAANPDYFEGRPYIDEIVYRIIPDQATQFLELQAGNLDYMDLSPLDAVYKVRGAWWAERFRQYRYPAFSYAYLGWNLDKPLFRDVRVRQALTLAIDRQEIIQGVLLGLGRTTIGPIKPGTWAYADDIAPWPFDPERAKALLAEAGWTDSDHDGWLDKDGKPFVFTILTNQGNSQRIRAAVIIQYRLAQIGVRVSVRTVEWAAFIQEFINPGRFDAVLLAWTMPLDPDPYDVWHSVKAEPGGLNFVHYKNAELDGLLTAARATLDRGRRRTLYHRVQEILHRDQPYCFLYVPMALPIVAARVQGIEPAPAGIGYNMNQWWIPTDRQDREPALTP